MHTRYCDIFTVVIFSAQWVDSYSKVMRLAAIRSSRRAASRCALADEPPKDVRQKARRLVMCRWCTRRDTKKQPTRKPKRSGGSVDLPVKDQINAFHRELSAFVTNFSDRFRAWLETKPKLDDDAHGAMLSGLFVFTEQLSGIDCQEFDGDR